LKIPLSKRLLACCDFVRPGDRVADVGTDHGYLGIWLLSNHIASSVIASDIVPGPLSAATRNAEKFGCADRMEFYLSDGVQTIPRDFNTLVCAGMGADTMIGILSNAPWLCDGKYRLILQCQSKTVSLRRYLSEHGFTILKEIVLRDGHFLYTVIETVYSPSQMLTPGQWYISPALLRSNCKELMAYYSWLLNGLEHIVAAKGSYADANEICALAELRALSSDPALQPK